MSRFGHIDAQLTLPIQYFGTVNYYAAMGACRRVVVDDTLRYDKRLKSTHRMDIIDTHGVKSLTVPVSRREGVEGVLNWSNIAISRHGCWWHVIAETLASAYGRTPFFEFYIDRLSQFFSASTPDDFSDVASLCREVDIAVRAILGLDNEVVYQSELVGNGDGAAGSVSNPYLPITMSEIAVNPVRYYQVRQDKFGFVANLSILDLIFNMGAESALILREMSGAYSR